MTARLEGLWVSNYRSLGDDVAVEFGALTAFVGPNGSGKSNILDVFRFLRDALTVGLEPAITQRLGIERLRRASPKGARDVSIAVRVRDGAASYYYELKIKSAVRGRYRVEREYLEWRSAGTEGAMPVLEVNRGVLTVAPGGLSPSVTDDELVLLGVAAHPQVRPLVDALRAVRVHSLYPRELGQPQSTGGAPPLDDTGSNWCTVLRSLSPMARGSLFNALGVVLDDVVGVSAVAVGGYYSASFAHRLPGGEVRQFAAAQESDGTLRLAGLLTALVQDELPPLLGIEEPELTINPGLLPLLHDYLVEASERCQVVITTHSPDLLDLLDVEQIRVVQRREGVTTVGPVAEYQKTTVRQALLGPGTLLRSGALESEEAQRNLFDEVGDVALIGRPE